MLTVWADLLPIYKGILKSKLNQDGLVGWIPNNSCGVFPRYSREVKVEANNEIIKLSPNPSSGYLYIEMMEKNEENISGKIFNMMGKEEMDFSIRSGNSTIDLRKLAPGIYLLRTSNNKSNTFIKL